MRRADRRSQHFVRTLLSGGEARRNARGEYAAGDTKLLAAAVEELMSAGVLAGDRAACRATPEARTWLKRALLDDDAFAAQHRLDELKADGTRVNLAECPLSRLASAPAGGTPFLEPHQVEAGERVRRLVERAQLQPRVTMSYSAAHTAGGKGIGHAAEISDMAADARRELAEIARLLPADCAGVVLDVCGMLKGLQAVELERGWPRRSAKLVLRIGLEQLAQHFGLAPVATGIGTRRRHVHMEDGARPTLFE